MSASKHEGFYGTAKVAAAIKLNLVQVEQTMLRN
jgi:hypothetical protein